MECVGSGWLQLAEGWLVWVPSWHWGHCGGEPGQEMWRLPQEPQPQGLSGAAQSVFTFCPCHDYSLQNVGDSALCSFSTYCCNIETLNLSTCSKLSDKTLHSLASNCAKLHTLNISSCSNLTDNSLRAIGHGCPNVNDPLCLYEWNAWHYISAHQCQYLLVWADDPGRSVSSVQWL